MNMLQRSIVEPLSRVSEDKSVDRHLGSDVLEAVRTLMPTEKYWTREMIFEAMERFLASAGVDHWMLAAVPMPGGDLRPNIIRAQWPENWMQKYIRDDLGRFDPVFLGPVAARMAMREGEIVAACAHLPRASTILAEYAANGISNHFAVPCLRIGAYHAIIMMAGRTPISEDNIELIVAMVRRLADRLHAVAPELMHRGGQLTARERQIVTLTAEGKTSNKIAAELGISARTVFAHLTAAGAKLKAANKTECVVNAYRHGQIAF